MRRNLSLLVVVGVLWSAGCYESEFPFDTNAEAFVEQALIGTWRCLPMDGAPAATEVTLVVSFPEARIYDVAWTEAGDRAHRQRAYGSSLMARLLNVQDMDQAAGAWRFVRYTLLRPNIVHLQVVSASALKGVPSNRIFVRQAIDRLRESQSLFTDLGVCAKTKP